MYVFYLDVNTGLKIGGLEEIITSGVVSLDGRTVYALDNGNKLINLINYIYNY